MMTLGCKPHEIWREIPGYEEQYEVSSLGNVRSIDHYIDCVMSKTGTPFRKRIKGRSKKPTLANTGYLVVNLGHNNTKNIHELVALAFFGERPAGNHICHGDGNKTNNVVSNLRYDTQSENNRDKLRYGGRMKKLRAEDVLAIRDAGTSGVSRKTIAQQFGISTTMVSYIINRRCFAWL